MTNSNKPKFERPGGWVEKDPVQHEKYIPYLRARSQAAYRNESWTLTWEEFKILWPNQLWEMRGRKTNSMVMMRVVPELGWHLDNIIVLARGDQLRIKIQQGVENRRKQREDSYGTRG